MQDSRVKVKGYFGLKALGVFFRIVAFVCLVITLITVGAAIVSFVTNPGIGAASTNTTQGTIGAVVITYDKTTWVGTLTQAVPFAFWALMAYATSQGIDIILSINDNLRRLAQPGQQAAKDLQQAAEQMTAQTKKISALLEQHHRRIERLETERKA